MGLSLLLNRINSLMHFSFKEWPFLMSNRYSICHFNWSIVYNTVSNMCPLSTYSLLLYLSQMNASDFICFTNLLQMSAIMSYQSSNVLSRYNWNIKKENFLNGSRFMRLRVQCILWWLRLRLFKKTDITYCY